MTIASRERQSYVPRFSLPQHLYLDEKQYRDEVKWLKETLWLFVDHESRIPRTGDFFLYEFDKTNIIIIRDREGRVRAHYNVCRHRGSRICTESSGTKQSLICLYHAWTFGLDGRLRAAAFMPKDFDKEQYGLTPCHVRVHCGLIFISFAQVPTDFSTFIGGFTRELEFNDVQHAKIIQRSRFVTAANWKLVIENNNECYHCRPAHPTYWAAHPGTLIPLTDEGSYGKNLWQPMQESDSEKARQFEAIIDGEDSAVEGVDFLTSRVTAVFDATMREDKTIVEHNQLGVESEGYRPGRYCFLHRHCTREYVFMSCTSL
jgi:phenylpropionate dioxygenase-like ring-hydroxylating dioxygenase large terminal subunit